MLDSKGSILRKKFQNRFVIRRSDCSKLNAKRSDLSRKIGADIRLFIYEPQNQGRDQDEGRNASHCELTV